MHSSKTTQPINLEWHSGIVQGLTSESDQTIHVDVESTDLTHFADTDFASDLLDVYRRKYGENQPDLIIPTDTPAFQFLLKYGADLFPGVPIVFCAADAALVAAQELPPNITGLAITPDIEGTIELVLQAQPALERLVLVVGEGAAGRRYETYARQALAEFVDRFEIQWLHGLSSGELAETARNITGHAAILYLVETVDRYGKPQIPVKMLPQMSKVAGAPIYGLWDSLIGRGIVGGRLITIHDDGVTAGQIGLKILNGSAPSEIPVMHKKPNPAIFDGQELARWNIDERLLPADSRIFNRRPSIWAQYRTEITAIGFVVFLQALLILALMINRTRLSRARTDLQQESDRRRQAEIAALSFRDELDKFGKERFLSAMATTIAHEINQPLIAIQNYAQAARRRADGQHRHTEKLDELLGKIDNQAGRAGDIIKNVRALVHADEADRHSTSLSSIVAKVLEVLESELEIRKCTVEYVSISDLPRVSADELQVQLVLVNLLRNAMISMANKERRADKVIKVEINQFADEYLCVSVTDRGTGISAEKLEAVFEPMYSGSGEGMGMGLAICRMIIDTHGGRIWCDENPGGGARFQFTLATAI